MGTGFVLESHSAAETQAYGEALATLLQPNDVLLLCGELGAGKTQFAQGIAAGLGISQPITSPTFNILLVYDIEKPVEHSASQEGRQGQQSLQSPQGPQGREGRPSRQAPQGQQAPLQLYHFDLYRLEEAEQLVDIDYFAMLEDGAISLVEWGDRFAEVLPLDYLLIELNISADGHRQIAASSVGQRSTQLLAGWQASL